ncbi:cytidine deaminase [Williamsia sp. CHRR-6]|uniref:cytidine deaminase n=1 Tax=Williamsia sp. CHRR-6 TaxID=2835871 RepID=UPI001BD994B2|nr:cytidine deaminase [Williamsia sp. CHRR-6]MBT0565381.1 cytidine deaminase [Williamsia sp. CHRR-6]
MTDLASITPPDGWRAVSVADELAGEDAKLVVLARGAMARAGAPDAAAVRDGDGRTYASTGVNLPSLQLSALQVAVAMAVSSGAAGMEAAVVLGGEVDDAGLDAVGEFDSSATAYITDPAGRVRIAFARGGGA